MNALAQGNPHRRWNPLKREWVLVSPNRTQRPWQGQTEDAVAPTGLTYDPNCYLCPGNLRAGGARTDNYTSTYVFENDYAALKLDSPTFHEDDEGKGLLVAEGETGTCRVVCFSPRHDLTLAKMSVAEIRAVVDVWVEQYQELGARDDIAYVQVFENRGAMMGASNPHPHGQIWASRSLTNEIVAELGSQREYLAKHGTNLLVEYAALELGACAGERIVAKNANFLAVVPFWAVWPFEVLVLPTARRMRDLEGMNDAEREDFAAILREVTSTYDQVFNVSFPYSMGLHPAPSDGEAHEEWQFHAHFYPPLLRSATVRKFMVGFELLGGPQRDITAESAAETLRQAAGETIGAYEKLGGVLCVMALSAACIAQDVPEQPEKYQWLEDVSSARSMAWVAAENARSANVLDADPRFAGLEATALKVLESPDRIAIPVFREGAVWNTWQDAQHVRGILRKTTLVDYLTADPHWTTVIDYDALAKKDNEKWVQKGLNCLYPGDGLCLVVLSAGGEDADTLREFDLESGPSGKFVEGGFVLPKSKQRVTWVDKDTLLVARDWGPGTMTSSGYAFVVKVWKRGQPLDAAKEVFRGTEADVSAGAETLNDAQGHRVVLLNRQVNFFESEQSLWTPDGVKRLALPAKSEVNGLLHGRLIVTLNEDWQPGTGSKFAQGTVVSLDLAAVMRDPAHLVATTVFAPTADEFAQEVAMTRDKLLLTTLAHVQGRAYVYSVAGAGWTRAKLDLPENVTVDLVSTNESDDKFFLRLSGFLTPSSLLLGDGTGAELKVAKTLPPQFDATGEKVEQLEATSKDGTKVPYFVVHRATLKYDGSNPTLMGAYGGFQVSETPQYSGILGKLWLERGGVYVLANIRGGGEFGPAWHEAGLKTHRQRIYDDFAAVGADLVARKITSPRRLGIVGGSNGGLLMGVEMTEHPEMWRAIVIQVPLLDMLRFEHIAAGASWVGEYGSVTVPEERRFLAKISPYNQLKPNATYPEPLIFTTTKDDRVGPVHARKFAARMEEFGKPFFYDEIVEGGHGAGANLKEQANTWATQYTYLSRKLMD